MVVSIYGFYFCLLSNQISEDLVKSMHGWRKTRYSFLYYFKNSLMSANIFCRLFVLFIDCQVPRSTFFLTEILFLSLHHYWRCKILVFCGCFISSNVLFVFSVMLASIVIIVCRLVFMHSACVYFYHFCILRVFKCIISAFISLCQYIINLI